MSLFGYFKFEDNTDKRIRIAARLTFLTGFGLFGWLATLTNFSIETLNISAFDIGLILSFKELTLIFGFILTILLSYISESRMLGILVAVSGMGIILTGFSGSEIGFMGGLYDLFGSNVNKFAVNLMIFTFILSLGMNFFEAARDSLIKHSTESSRTAIVLSKITAYGLLGTASGYFFISIIGFFKFDYIYFIIYIALGAPLIIGGILSSQQAKPAKSLKENVEIIIRGKFFNFYILTFFTSAINIIMIFFGIFLLVSEFKIGLGYIGLIFLIHSSLTFFFRAKAANIMKKKGEDVTMKVRYAVTFLFFISLMFVPNKFILIGLLAVYGITKLFDTSIKSFISYFARPDEQRSNLVIYTRLNEIAAILIPILSGWIWITYGYRSVFGLGAIFSAICFLVAYKIYAAFQSTDEPVQQEEE